MFATDDKVFHVGPLVDELAASPLVVLLPDDVRDPSDLKGNVAPLDLAPPVD